MKKPVTVPEEARWNEDNYEWELGKRNKNGDEIGEWSWWEASEGYLSCHAFFTDDGNLVSVKRFHPNGECSLELSYSQEGKELSVYYASEEDTMEYFPENRFKNAWKAERIVGSSPKAYNFYDKTGRQLSVLGNHTAEIEKLKTAPENETAEQAIKRLNKVITLLKENKDLDEEIIEELDILHKPHHIKTITETELNTYEKHLGVQFPPSYKEFVLKHGFIKFGEVNDFNRMLFSEYNVLSDSLAYWGIDSEKAFSKETKNRLDKIITFSYGDEGLQIEWFHCFDYNTLNPETGEVSVMDFCQDDSNTPLENSTTITCKGRGFDHHMSSIVNKEIEILLIEY